MAIFIIGFPGERFTAYESDFFMKLLWFCIRRIRSMIGYSNSSNFLNQLEFISKYESNRDLLASVFPPLIHCVVYSFL